MKVFVVLSALCLMARAEAPVDNYGMRPPSANAYSSSYDNRGLTDARFGEFGSRTAPSHDHQHHHNHDHDHQHSFEDYNSASSYDAPSTSYGAPSNSYGAPSNSYSAPSNSYGAPSNSYGAPSNSYGAPSHSYDAPSSNYGAPSMEYGAPSQKYGAPSTEYGAPTTPSSRYGPPAQKYGPPAQKYGPPRSAPKVSLGKPIKSNSYGSRSTPAPFKDSYSRRTEQAAGGPYPAARASNDDMSEPASYEFKYEVNDAGSGQEFGHMEAREGDVVTGEYRVLLPDGRTQVVKYVADKNGYRPTIEYLEPNQQQGGYY